MTATLFIEILHLDCCRKTKNQTTQQREGGSRKASGTDQWSAFIGRIQQETLG